MKKRGILIILLITFSAIIFYGYRYVNSPVITKTAKLSQLEEVVTGEAFVIRNEVVYSAETSGTLYNYINEGARVAKNMLLSTVFRGSVDEELIRELNNIDIKIEKLNKRIEQNETFTKDKNSVENKIESIKDNVITASLNNNISKISEYKDAINYLSGDMEDADKNEVNELINQKRRMETQFSNDKNDIRSTISGMFSQNVDGYEAILTPESIMQYRVGDYVQIPATDVRKVVSNNVNAGENVCKVVDNHNWYAMTVMPNEKAQDLKKKKDVLIRFDELPGDEVAAEVVYVSQEEADEENAVVVLKSDRYLEGVYSMRSGIMEIIVNRYVGFEVPIYAIRTVEGKTGVMKAIGNSELFCECKIVHQDDETGTAIIYPVNGAKNSIEIGDDIILGEKVSDGSDV